MGDYGALYRRTVELEVEAKFHRAEIERLKSTIAHLVGSVGGQYSSQQANEVWLQKELDAFRADLVRSNSKQIDMGSIGRDDVVPLAPVPMGEQRDGADYEPSESSGASDRAETGSVSNGGDDYQQFQVDLIDLGNDMSRPVQDLPPASNKPAVPPTSARVPDPIKHKLNESTVAVARPGASCSVIGPPFHEHERRKIIGFATWIEDWTEDEVDDGWAEFAKVNHSHTAEEWKIYYETVIRVHLVEKGQIQNEREVEMDPPATIVDTSHKIEPQRKSSDVPEAECHGESNSELPTKYAETTDHKKSSIADGSELAVEIQGQQSAIPPSCLLLSSGDHNHSTPELIMGEGTRNIQIVDHDCANPESNFHFENVGSKTSKRLELREATSFTCADPGYVETYGGQLRLITETDPTKVQTHCDTSGGFHVLHTRAAEVAGCTNNDDVDPSVPGLATHGSPEGATCSVSSDARRESIQDKRPTHHSQAFTTLPNPSGLGNPRGELDRLMTGYGKDICLRSFVWPGENQDVQRNLRSDDKSLQHTVMVSNIKPGTSLLKVLNCVRGGRIVSATYIETSKRIRNVKADVVMVVFFIAAQARAYVEFCTDNTIGIEASMIESPTFSCKLKKHRSLAPSGDLSMESRVLYLEHPSLNMTGQQTLSELENLKSKLEEPLKRPLLVKQSETGRVLVEFASVVDARAVKAAASGSDGALRNFGRGFAIDPCEGPLQELLGYPACDTC